jgi:WD40 repeat protein
MKFLPNEKFTISTQEPLSQVIEKLEAHIEAPKTIRWRFSRNHAPYAGTISDSGFKIYRIIHYRNSFLPIIRGKFESSSEGTRIYVTMNLNPFVLAFLLFLFFPFLTLIPTFFVVLIFQQGFLSPEILFLGFPIFILFIFWCAFWYEANRSREELIQIIEGKYFEPETVNKTYNKQKYGIWLRGLLILIVIGNIIANLGLFSLVQQESPPLVSQSCSQLSTQSPYCKLTVAYTLEGYPTESALAISSDGKILVSGGEDKAIKIWDLQTGELKKILQSDSGVINTLAISPDGKTIVSGSGDRMIRIWNITSDQPPRMLKGHSNNVSQVEISSDGKTIMSRDYEEIKVWDFETGELKTTLPNLPSREFKIGSLVIEDNSSYFNPLTISSKGTALVKFENKIVAWNITTNEQITLQQKMFENLDIYSGRISLDGKTVVMTSYTQPKNYLQIWNLKTGKLKTEQQFSTSYIQNGLSSYTQRGLYDIVLTRDRIIGSTKDDKLKVWNLETAELEATLEQEKMSHLVVSYEGKFLAGITGNFYNQDTKIKVLKRP